LLISALFLFSGFKQKFNTAQTGTGYPSAKGHNMDLIIGGGKYGCHAIDLLRSQNRDFAVIDIDPHCQAVTRFNIKATANLPTTGEHFVQGDLPKAIELIDALKPEYVFPTAPIHIAAEMAKIKFKLTPWVEVINCILPKLPQSIVLKAGQGGLVLSFNRDNHCQEKCSMPETCTTSHVKKPCTMTRLMEYASPEAFILVSHSMAPGMGALKSAELKDFFSWAEGKREFVVGTACDCHGVFSAFRKV
jgi:hypothetical protein